jgi:hypothetical protein
MKKNRPTKKLELMKETLQLVSVVGGESKACPPLTQGESDCLGTCTGTTQPH